MKSRERAITAMEHKEPDRMPLDGWFRPETTRSLQKHFGVTDEFSLKRKLGIDFFQIKMHAAEEFRKKANERSDLRAAKDTIRFGNGTFQDEWGVKYRIGATGDFYHIVENPLQNVEPARLCEALDEYAFPDINAPGRFDEAKEAVKKYGDEFASIAMIGTAFFSGGMVLRGWRAFIYDLYTNPSFVNELLDRVLKFKIEQGKRFVEIGTNIVLIADDIGIQKTMLIKPDLWRRYFKPRMQKMITELKKSGQIHILFHSDGYIEPVIPDLIEIGVDALNPIQPECMDPAEIKRKYGDKLTLHGTISAQKTLPTGSIDDVKREVIERIKTCGQGGGFVLAPANFITPDVPLENVVTLYRTAKKYGKYIA